MSTETSKNAANLQRFLVFAAPAYWLITAFLYNSAYWGAFDINVLQFASITDMAKMAVYPVVSFAAIMVFAILLNSLPTDLFPKMSRKISLLVLAISFVPILLGFSTAVFVALIALSIAVWKQNMVLANVYENKNLRLTLLILFVSVPFYSHMTGEGDAIRVLDGKSDLRITVDGYKCPLIGVAGDWIFYFDDEASAVGAKRSDEISTFELYSRNDFERRSIGLVRLYRWLAD